MTYQLFLNRYRTKHKNPISNQSAVDKDFNQSIEVFMALTRKPWVHFDPGFGSPPSGSQGYIWRNTTVETSQVLPCMEIITKPTNLKFFTFFRIFLSFLDCCFQNIEAYKIQDNQAGEENGACCATWCASTKSQSALCALPWLDWHFPVRPDPHWLL